MMKQCDHVYLALIVASIAASPGQASEWGCEVLLCASSSNPPWKGIESCHPPMERLITAMGKPGFSWPTCPEGGASKPGYERYDNCPAGWAPTDGEGAYGARSGEQSRCVRRVNVCKDRRIAVTPKAGNVDHSRFNDDVTHSYRDRNSCFGIETIKRPTRTDPYYFDIKESGTSQMSRFWFNLQK